MSRARGRPLYRTYEISLASLSNSYAGRRTLGAHSISRSAIGRFAMRQHLSHVAHAAAFALAKASAAVASALRTTMAVPSDRYRPEAHYMRGPGPQWRAKHAPDE